MGIQALKGYPGFQMANLQNLDAQRTLNLFAAAYSMQKPALIQMEASVSVSVIFVSLHRQTLRNESLSCRKDVLNRFASLDSDADLIHVMMYIFPRHFGLHNVFTSVTDYRETSFQFKDYTIREQEIAKKKSALLARGSISRDDAYRRLMPKRLRGPITDMVRKLRKLHHRCSYTELLRHYCRVEVSRRLQAI